MQALYSCIKELPSNILFHKGQNLQVDGFRWAPKSLLSEFKSEVGLGVSINPVATIGDKGLHVRFPGFILADLRRPRELGNGFYFRKASDSESIQHLDHYEGLSDFSSSNFLKGNLAETTGVR